MKNIDLKSEYLEKAYELHRLFDQRTELAHRLMDYEFDLRYDKKQLSSLQKNLNFIEKQMKRTEKELNKIISSAENIEIKLPIEHLVKSYNLGREEKYVILNMFFDEMAASSRYHISRGTRQLELLGYTPDRFIEKGDLINSLLEKGLIQIVDRDEHPLIFKNEIVLSETAIKGIIGSEEKHEDREEKQRIKLSHRRAQFRRFGEILMIREPLLSFDQIVLDSDKQNAIGQALYQANNLRFVMEEWGFSDTIKYGKGTTMLFYGPPGTGKTATCEAIAYELKKNLGIVNYAQILNCYVGETEKALELIFKQAKEEDCLLVFDEADAMFARRIQERHSTDRFCNYMTNILMQEIERFEGVVILTTNREVAMDKAFERRIILKLQFDIPSPRERAKIWRVLIPEKAPLAPDVDFDELGRIYELTGGEIKNAILNASLYCARNNLPHLTMSALQEFAEKETKRVIDTQKKRVGFKT